MALPLVLQVCELNKILKAREEQAETPAASRICLVDLRGEEAYAAGHIPGAVMGNPSLLNRVEAPMGGLLPEPQAVNRFLAEIGARVGDHIVAFDAGLETAAARMIWVLDAYGYEASSWVSGGFRAWTNAALPTSTDRSQPEPGDLSVNLIGGNVISTDELLDELDNPDFHVLDVRSAAEYAGGDVRSAHGGHVPGARHLEWTMLLDDEGQLRDDDDLRKQFAPVTGSLDQPVIVYCQTHQRSSVSYVALKHLGYTDVRAIDGAWSNWGNREDTPKVNLN